MDLQDKYDELENIVNTIDNLTDELTDKYYIDCLNEIKFEAQNDIKSIWLYKYSTNKNKRLYEYSK